jgi:hypothetical protein
MVFEITHNGLQNFFEKKSSLRDLVTLCPSGYVYYIDIDDNIDFKRFFQSDLDSIPTSYLPSEKSFYNERHYEKYADIMKRRLKEEVVRQKMPDYLISSNTAFLPKPHRRIEKVARIHK